MGRSLDWALGLMVTLAPAVAVAQAAPVPQDTPPPGGVVIPTPPGEPGSTRVQAGGSRYTGPTFWVLGLPIRFAAPVPPPYAGTAYATFAGQPETGLDNVMAQSPGTAPPAP